jgi:hypothetical protein
MKKLEEFYLKFQARDKIKKINIFYIITLIFMNAFFTYLFFQNTKNLSTVQSYYQSMQKLSDIPYQISQVNLYNSKIWCVQDYQFQTLDFHRYYPPLSAASLKLA